MSTSTLTLDMSTISDLIHGSDELNRMKIEIKRIITMLNAEIRECQPNTETVGQVFGVYDTPIMASIEWRVKVIERPDSTTENPNFTIDVWCYDILSTDHQRPVIQWKIRPTLNASKAIGTLEEEYINAIPVKDIARFYNSLHLLLGLTTQIFPGLIERLKPYLDAAEQAKL